MREIIRQVCAEMGVTIINGALSLDHVHMFVEKPPHVSVSDFVRRAKGRSSRKIQQEFEHIRKRYRGRGSGAGFTSRPLPATSPTTSSWAISISISARMVSAPPHLPASARQSFSCWRAFVRSDPVNPQPGSAAVPSTSYAS